MTVTTTTCGCYTCDDERRREQYERDGDFAALFSRYMIVCPECGNKRCPKSTHHDNDCTGSNEPNQLGSRYQYGPISE